MARTRIGRIKKGEKVITPILTEPLQELYDARYIAQNTMDDALEETKEETDSDSKKITPEQAKKLWFICKEAYAKDREFWEKVHTQYNTWNKHIGIRDGYALVEVPPDQKLKLPRFLQDLEDFFKSKGFEGGGVSFSGPIDED